MIKVKPISSRLTCKNNEATLKVVLSKNLEFTIEISYLEWDTIQLGFKTGFISFVFKQDFKDLEIYDLDEVFDILKQTIIDLNYNYTIIRLNTNEVQLIQYMENIGFNIIDTVVTFSALIEEVNDSITMDDQKVQIRTVKGHDLTQLQSIAKEIFTLDRFHKDPVINKESADNLYKKWIENSCLKIVVSEVMVAEINGEIVGFITCKFNNSNKDNGNSTTGIIDLVGVSKSVQGMGIGKILVNGAIGWFKNKKIATVKVGTQLINIPAIRLYQNMGFVIEGSQFTLRKYIG